MDQDTQVMQDTIGTLTSFIDKYYLSGNIDRAVLSYDGSQLETAITTKDKALHGYIRNRDFEYEENFEIALFNTKQFKKLIKALNGDVTIHLEKNMRGIYNQMILRDEYDTEVTFNLGNKRYVNVPPKHPTADISFHAEFEITPEFYDRFKKSIKAVTSDMVMIEPTDENVSLNIGWVEQGTSDTVTLNTQSGAHDFTSHDFVFRGDLLAEILKANSESINSEESSSICRISNNHHVMQVEFSNISGDATYHIARENIE